MFVCFQVFSGNCTVRGIVLPHRSNFLVSIWLCVEWLNVYRLTSMKGVFDFCDVLMRLWGLFLYASLGRLISTVPHEVLQHSSVLNAFNFVWLSALCSRL